jgi:NAD-reducing hydrogenase large subunit
MASTLDTADLETAADPKALRRVVIEPLSRVEGHGKVTILLDQDDHVRQVRLHIVEFRGFERFVQGRPYWEVPVLVQRICGICPVAHQIASSKAMDMMLGIERLTPTAEKIRRLMHYGQILQSNALHFFHFATPDLLFGFDSDRAKRNIVGVAAEHPDIARKGVLLRKFGQEVIRHTSGKRVHGTGAIPGGVNKSLTPEERDGLLADVYKVIEWAREAVALAKRLQMTNAALYNSFAAFRSNMLSIVAADGSLDMYHGNLRARDASGQIILDGADYRRYDDYIELSVKPWTYLKFPFLRSLGRENGWYKVGPLSRVQNCDSIPTPFAEAERKEFVDYGGAEPVHATLAYHWARMIEVLFAAEQIKELLQDDDVLGDELVTTGKRQQVGVGIIEAPRGTLIHHYHVNEDDLVDRATLIVSTTNNNQAMNESIRQVAKRYLDGRKLTEGLLNHIEVAVRAFDPCLSCSTHALGKMALAVELVDAEGGVLDRLSKDGSTLPCPIP